MAIIAYPNLMFVANNMPQLTCMTCGDPMSLIPIEPLPNTIGYDVRTFACKSCDVVESFVIDLSQP